MTGDFSTLPFWLDGEAKPSTPAEMNWALSYIVEAELSEGHGNSARSAGAS